MFEATQIISFMIYIEITNNKLTQIDRSQTCQQTNLTWDITSQIIACGTACGILR